MEIIIAEEDINSANSKELIDKLSKELLKITGNDGTSSFNNKDMNNKKSIFVIARNEKNEAIGCGALRCIDNDTAEIKRMYSKIGNYGVGSKILEFLEKKAKVYKYQTILIETRKINKNAVKFYIHNGYKIIDNYGKYKGKDEAVCFQKNI